MIDNELISVDDKDRRLINRGKIEQLSTAIDEAVGKKGGQAKEINDNGLKEHFVGGAYIRELFIPKNAAIVSQLWNKDRFWIIAYGDVTITDETQTKRVKGPYTEIPVYGSRIALYTHEDTLWFAITGAESTNSEDIEKEVIVKTHEMLVYPWDKLEKQL